MRIAQYRGISTSSRIIKFLTRGPYSHSAFVFDAKTATVAWGIAKKLSRLPFLNEGAVVEAWMPCVRNVHSISSQHTPGTVVDLFGFNPALTDDEEEKLLLILNNQIGTPYALRDVLRFVTRRPGHEKNRLFCSELVFKDSHDIGRMLLAETQAWEVPPSWIQRSWRLYRAATAKTA